MTAITFSDSVFIATNHLFEATTFAANLAQSTLSQKIPVRMGIAFGSFAALRFRSDVSADGGDHAAQFLGTAVVRAYQAENVGSRACGFSFIHQSSHYLLTRPTVPPRRQLIRSLSDRLNVLTPSARDSPGPLRAGLLEFGSHERAQRLARAPEHAGQLRQIPSGPLSGYS